MTDRMAMAILRLLIAMARYQVRRGCGDGLLKEASDAEAVANERGRIS